MNQAQALEELQQSEAFRRWSTKSKPHKPTTTAAPGPGLGPTFKYQGETYTNLLVDEKHFTPAEMAKAWGVSPQTIRELFKNEEGVLKIGSKGTRTHRAYKTLRMPESVAERVHTRLAA